MTHRFENRSTDTSAIAAYDFLQGPKTPAILVVGDLILDVYQHGSVTRLSPEAPVPVFVTDKTRICLGGAANVAHNLRTLGCNVSLLGLIGSDSAGDKLVNKLQELGINASEVLRSKARPTTEKTRFISSSQHILRVDKEESSALLPSDKSQLLQRIDEMVKQVDGVVLSDYQKGVLDPEIIRAVVASASRQGIPVVCDPKGYDYSRYVGADVVTPNLKELQQAVGYPISGVQDPGLEKAAKEVLSITQGHAILVTCGAEGMVLFTAENNYKGVRIYSEAKEIFDVTGAGDTVVAVLAAAYFSDVSLKNAAIIANTAAGVVVGRLGTSSLTRAEISEAVRSKSGSSVEKHISLQALQQVKAQALDEKKWVFTNGCFDLLHAGHVHYLEAAAAEGDILVVGMNSDASVERLKGPGRPISDEVSRARVLSGLACVNYVVTFTEATPLKLVKALRPDVLVKGDDYAAKDVVGAKEVVSWGGRLSLIPVLKGRSTSVLVERAQHPTQQLIEQEDA